MHSKRLCALPITLLASIVYGHVILETPTPYIWPADGHFNPLDPSGDDWPCKMPAGTSLIINGSATVIPVGVPQTATFVGTAVHGGGSCQFSLIEGFEPSKTNSDFRVIKSIEGGCPAINQTGNLEDGQSPDSYEYTIPDTVAPGNYTFVWTWDNKISGSPEFYMNCAPITVTGSSSSGFGSLKDLPPMFMANIGEVSGGCTTEAAVQVQQAISYPNPGLVVEYPEGTSKLIKQPCDGNPLAISVGSSSSVAPVASVAPASSSVSIASSSYVPTTLSSTITSSTPSPTPSPSVEHSTVVLSSASLAPPIVSSISSTRVPSTFLTSRVSSSTSSSVPVPTSTSVPAVTCTDGDLLCLGTMFSTCTGGSWIAPQLLGAPGSGIGCAPVGSIGVGLNITNSAITG